MKTKTSLLVLLSITQLSVAPAFAKKDDSHENILAKERARIEQSSAEIALKKAELVELDAQIKQVRAQLAKAQRSTNINTAIFLSSSVVTAIGLCALGKGLSARAWSGSKILGLYFGIPMTAVGTTVAGISGVKLIIRTGDAEEFNVKLAGLEDKVEQKLAAVQKAEQQVNEAKAKLCLLEENRPADCAQPTGFGGGNQ